MKLFHSKKILTILAILCAYSLQAVAGGPTFYYQIYAESTPTGYGKVYVEDKEVTPADTDYRDIKGTGIRKQSSELNVTAVTLTAYLYAKPEDGYMFTHWARVNESTGEEDIFSWSKYTTDIFTSTTTTSDTAKKASYRAHFSKIGLVYPVSSDEGLGSVNIDIPENTIGDEVTLTAKADKLSGKFKGWQYENSSTLITDNPYTITVSESNKGTYTAVFESKDVATKGIYCYVRNVGSKRLLGVSGSKEGTIDADNREFKHSLMLVPQSNARSHCLPGVVVKVTGESTMTGGLENVEMIAQGISTYDFSGYKFRVEKRHDGIYYIFGNYKGFSGYIKDYGRKKRTIEFIGDVISPTIGNRAREENEAQWQLEVIDEEYFEDNYFGAMADENCTKNGKYYTTLYTAFPYKCLDGVKAYTIDKLTESGMPHLAEIESGLVPAYTAVVLECNGTQPVENRLMPLTEDIDPITTDNMLKGEIVLDDVSGDEANYRTAFDPTYMRILGEGGKFVNYNVTDPTSGKVLTYIANNTCYLDLSSEENPAEELDFTKIDNVLKGDADGNGLINMSDVTTTINYILGRSVKTFIFNNADVREDEKINMSDVTGIINIILGK